MEPSKGSSPVGSHGCFGTGRCAFFPLQTTRDWLIPATITTSPPGLGFACDWYWLELGGEGHCVGGSVEESNVDIATEFAKLIVAQQAYSANAKSITTFNQVSQATLAMIQ